METASRTGSSEPNDGYDSDSDDDESDHREENTTMGRLSMAPLPMRARRKSWKR